MCSKYDWNSISPTAFEELCLDLAIAKYGRYTASINHTSAKHDGGRDIEIHFLDSLTNEIKKKFWGECKKHQRDIDLDTIGKNVVLVLEHRINKIIYYSTSTIRFNTKKSIFNVGASYGFTVEFCDGEALENELLYKKDIALKHGLNALSHSHDTENDLKVLLYLTEEAHDNLSQVTGADHFDLVWSNCFFVYVSLKSAGKPIENLKVECSSLNHKNLLCFLNMPVDTHMEPHTDALMSFYISIAWPCREKIQLPFVDITYEVNSESHKQCFPLGTIQLLAPYPSPLTGKKFHEAVQKLKNIIHSLQSDAHHYYFVDIRGRSGSGKTRLIEEIIFDAKRNKFQVIHLNCNGDTNLDIIKELIAALIDLPYKKGSIQFSESNFKRIIFENGGDSNCCGILCEFFIHNKIDLSEDGYYLKEAILHFLLFPRKQKNRLIIFDNLQCLNRLTIQFISDIIRKFPELDCLGGVVFITAMNTELFTAKDSIAVREFIEFANQFYRDNQFYNNVIQLICEPLNEDDDNNEALNLLIDLLSLDKSTYPLVKDLVKKCEGNPYNIFTLSRILDEQKIISYQSGFGFINDVQKFRQTLYSNRISHDNVTRKRLDFLTQDSNLYNVFCKIASSALLFGGYSYMDFIKEMDVDESAIFTLQRNYWIKNGDKPSTIELYHDNMYRTIQQDWQCVNHSNIAHHLTKWLHQNSDIIDEVDVVLFRCSLAMGKEKAAVFHGLNAMEYLQNLSDRNVVIEICEALYKLKALKNDKEKNFHFLWKYASLLLFSENIEKGLSLYREAAQYAGKIFAHLPAKDYYQLRHEYVNANLHAGRYAEALELLSKHEKEGITDPHYQFLLYNRYAVANTFLGEGQMAKSYLDKTMSIAKTTNEFDECTVWSDYGYNFLKNYRRGDKMRDAFCQAVALYHALDERYNYRDIEIFRQSAYVALYDKNTSCAEINILKSIEICERTHNSFSLLKSQRIYAYIKFLQGNHQSAYETLEENIKTSTLYGNNEGLMISYADLAGYYLVNEDYTMSQKYFDIFFDLLKTYGDQMVSRLIPIICNFALLNMLTNKQNENGVLAEIYKYHKVKMYIRYLTLMFNKNAGLHTKELKGIGIFSIGGASFLC